MSQRGMPPRQRAASSALIDIGARYGTDVSRDVGEAADELAAQSASPAVTRVHVIVVLQRYLELHPDHREQQQRQSPA